MVMQTSVNTMKSWNIALYTTFVMLATFVHLVGSENITTKQFHKISSPTSGPIHLNSGWTKNSLLACASSCLAKFPNCESLIYNKNTGRCIPGSTLNPNEPVPSSDEGFLYSYTSNDCNSQHDYNLSTVGDVSACLYFGTYETYQSAIQDCTAKGGHLLTVKTQERIELLHKFAIEHSAGYSVWIGLDDINTEDSFVWRETNTVWDRGSMLPFFEPGQPDNDKNNEDCVALVVASGKLNDIPCGGSQAVVCELNS